MNRLSQEKSPYLLQHADNPVDWYPWGEEAFEKAANENKPILVSIGYSTCHWCHVMERETFADPDVAAFMNRHLVNIKVDREERPDVDKIYMAALAAISGQGGWPLNIFLTPDRQPFFGGAYFPPVAREGLPAWREVVQQVAALWQDPAQRQKILDAGSQLAGTLQHAGGNRRAPLEGDPAWLEGGRRAMGAAYDALSGGFSPAPKFPMPVYHNFLLRYFARTKDTAVLTMSVHTLYEMAKGGLYDQLGGGFSRYATDARWRVPHFEKMLYDNAQLAVNYLEAFQITREPEFDRVARETLTFVQRNLTHPDGGFFSALDADSLPSPDAKEKREGAFYTWDKTEIIEVLGPQEGDVFCYRYGIDEKGDVFVNPPFIAHSIFETARRFNQSASEIGAMLQNARQKLLEIRNRRPPPHLDDKIITAWNGLMISAFAKAYQVLGDASYLDAARKAARFLRTSLYDGEGKILYRRWRDGERLIPGFAEDYAFVTQGLLDLWEADFDLSWLEWALELAEIQNQRFWDDERGGFYMTAAGQDDRLLVRVKEAQDHVEPSASSIAALNLLRLSQYWDRQDYRVIALKTIGAFGPILKESPQAMLQMLVALEFALMEPRQIVIAGSPDSADTQVLLRVLGQYFIPFKTVFLADGGSRQAAMAKRLPFLNALRPQDGKATAYLCLHRTCQSPASDPLVFQRFLQGLTGF